MDASSLLERDKWDNWVIRKDYNAAMLAEAVCKPEGFTHAPSDSRYWQHGHSTETDFIYVTTSSLTHAQLQQLSEEVGPERSLLVVCTSFRGSKEGSPNLIVKKIPKAVLSRYGWVGPSALTGCGLGWFPRRCPGLVWDAPLVLWYGVIVH